MDLSPQQQFVAPLSPLKTMVVLFENIEYCRIPWYSHVFQNKKTSALPYFYIYYILINTTLIISIVLL
jgi:hypothetical protein